MCHLGAHTREIIKHVICLCSKNTAQVFLFVCCERFRGTRGRGSLVFWGGVGARLQAVNQCCKTIDCFVSPFTCETAAREPVWENAPRGCVLEEGPGGMEEEKNTAGTEAQDSYLLTGLISPHSVLLDQSNHHCFLMLLTVLKVLGRVWCGFPFVN